MRKYPLWRRVLIYLYFVYIATVRAGKKTVHEIRRNIYNALWGLPETSIRDVIKVIPDVSVSPILEHSFLPPHVWPNSHDDLTPLLQIAAAARPAIILELGTANGNTVANLCRVCDARVYTVNALPEQISGNLVTVSPTKDEIGCVYREYGYSDRVTQIYANTMDLDLSTYLQTGTVGLAIIDACHDVEYVLHDFMNILPYIRTCGIVLLHDTHPSMEGHLRDSYLACTKLRRRGFEMKHIADTWWGVWIKPRL